MLNSSGAMRGSLRLIERSINPSDFFYYAFVYLKGYPRHTGVTPTTVRFVAWLSPNRTHRPA